MKKIIIAFVAVFVMGGSALAQWNLGARINNSWGFGAEFSAQKIFSESNRLELDLGVTGSSTYHAHSLYSGATAAYHWTFPIVKGLQWFVGPGVHMGIYSYYDDDYPDYGYSRFRLAAVAQGGIEYNFDFPLQLALDVRPGIDLLGFGDEVHHGHISPWIYSYAFSIRYRF